MTPCKKRVKPLLHVDRIFFLWHMAVMSKKLAMIKAAVDDIEARAFASRTPIYKVCERAGVAPSTFSRWRAGAVEPSGDTIDKLTDALTEIERERSAA